MKLKHVAVDDFLCRDGTPHKSSSFRLDGQSYQIHSKSDMLWSSIRYRTSKYGWNGDRNKTYSGVLNKFKNFTSFYWWCHAQVGYNMIDENNNYWRIDKDILSDEVPVYSEDTCCFIPEHLNSMLTRPKPNVLNSEFPPGAEPHLKRFKARCTIGKSRYHVGMYDTPIEAHIIWKREKHKEFSRLISQYSSSEGSREDVVAKLQEYSYDFHKQVDSDVVMLGFLPLHNKLIAKCKSL